MFRAVLCSSSGGQIVLLQHLVSSLSANGRTVCRLRAYCSLGILVNIQIALIENTQKYSVIHGPVKLDEWSMEPHIPKFA